MKANELSLGWAFKQPNPAAAVQQVLNAWRRYELAAIQRTVNAARWAVTAATWRTLSWAARRSDVFSAIAGEDVTRLDVIMAHAYLAVVIVIMFVASWLEGGAL